MTDKEKIREEVERLFKENRERSSIEGYAAVEQLRKVLAFIDSLEVKEVDLEKELDLMITSAHIFHQASPPLMDVAKHFYELGLKS